MLLHRVTLVTVFVLAATLWGVGTVAKCGARETGASPVISASSTDNDEPKKKDQPKEDAPQGFLGIRFDADQDSGPPTVAAVIDDSPAAKAGFKEGDKILKIGDKEAKDVQGTVELVRALKPGQKITVKIKRDDKDMELKVTIGKRPDEE